MNARCSLLVAVLFLLTCWPAAAHGGFDSGTRTPDNNDTPGTATDITSGIPVSDSVNSTDDQYDFYKVTGVVAGQTVRALVNYTEPSAQLNLSIRDPSGDNLTAVSSGGLTRGDTALAAFNGTFYVEVKAHVGASDYVLAVTVAFPPVIDPGSHVSGNLSADAANRTDFYRFWLDGNLSGHREVGLLNITQSDQGAGMEAAFRDVLGYRGSHIYNESWNLTGRGTLSAAASYTGWYFCQLRDIFGASGYILNYSAG